MCHDFISRFEKAWPRSQYANVAVLVAVSGGADSVALLRALVTCAQIVDAQAGRRLIADGEANRETIGGAAGDQLEPAGARSALANLVVAHYNHRWRGTASDEDATGVRHLADHLGLRAVIGAAASASPGSEENARDERYEFLKETAERLGARYIATAHTADDQAETVLHRILRGTGVSGLAGIPRVRLVSPAVTVIRPLLEFRRIEIEGYLRDIGQSFRTDASNDDMTFMRNRIRRELLPRLQDEFNPGTTEALLRLSRVADEYREFMAEAIAEKSARWTLFESDCEVRLDEAALRAASPLLVKEFFVAIWRRKGWPQQGMSYETWQALCRFVKSDEPAYPLPGKIECRRFEGSIRVMRQP